MALGLCAAVHAAAAQPWHSKPTALRAGADPHEGRPKALVQAPASLPCATDVDCHSNGALWKCLASLDATAGQTCNDTTAGETACECRRRDCGDPQTYEAPQKGKVQWLMIGDSVTQAAQPFIENYCESEGCAEGCLRGRDPTRGVSQGVMVSASRYRTSRVSATAVVDSRIYLTCMLTYRAPTGLAATLSSATTHPLGAARAQWVTAFVIQHDALARPRARECTEWTRDETAATRRRTRPRKRARYSGS